MKPQRLTLKLPTRMVAENTAAGANIGGPVVATDVDSGDTLTYTLGGTDAASFDIESTTTLRAPAASCKPRQHWTMKPRPTMR